MMNDAKKIKRTNKTYHNALYSLFFIHNSSSGQALIEAMVSISILTVGFLGILGLLSQSLSLNRVVSNSYVGTYLATEGLEIVKNIMDSNTIQGNAWNTGVGDCGSQVCEYEADYQSLALSANQDRALYFDTMADLYSYSGDKATGYHRLIKIEKLNPDEIRVTSIVSWPERGGANSSVDLEDHFFKWRP